MLAKVAALPTGHLEGLRATFPQLLSRRVVSGQPGGWVTLIENPQVVRGAPRARRFVRRVRRSPGAARRVRAATPRSTSVPSQRFERNLVNSGISASRGAFLPSSATMGGSDGTRRTAEGRVGAEHRGALDARAAGQPAQERAGHGPAGADRVVLRQRGHQPRGRRPARGERGHGRQVAPALRRAPPRRTVRRAPARRPAHHHRRPGRGGDRQDLGGEARQTPPTGRRARWPRRWG